MANYEINDIYDIATAFITDQNTTIKAKNTETELTYTFTKNGLDEHSYHLTIHAVKKSPQKLQQASAHPMSDGRVHTEHKTFTKKHYGEIKLSIENNYHINCQPTKVETNLLTYQTKNEVGSALDKKQSDMNRFITRWKSKKFFDILNMAESRMCNKIKTTDNSAQISNMLHHIR